MNATELDSFVFKFKNLWESGVDAHLDLECHAGQAWVGFRVWLGHAPGPHQPNIPPKPRRARDGPSRQYRRARRAAAREEHAEEAVKLNETPTNEADKGFEVENKAAEAEHNNEVNDEFCPNTDYTVDDPNEDNSVTFRFVITDSATSLEAFESNVKQNFVKTKVEVKNQIYAISG